MYVTLKWRLAQRGHRSYHLAYEHETKHRSSVLHGAFHNNGIGGRLPETNRLSFQLQQDSLRVIGEKLSHQSPHNLDNHTLDRLSYIHLAFIPLEPLPTVDHRTVSAMKQDQTAVQSPIQVETSSQQGELVAERLSSMQKSSKSTEPLMHLDKMENKDTATRTVQATVVPVQEQVLVEASSCLRTN